MVLFMAGAKAFTAATASPDTVGGTSESIFDPGSPVSDPTTATPDGGTGAPTYLWSYVSGDATISATASTSATTSFTATVFDGAPKSAVWRCAVTVGGVTLNTNNVSITLTHIFTP